MKAIISLVALAIQVAAAQSPDSAAAQTAVALPTIPVDTAGVASPASPQPLLPVVALPSEPAALPVPPPAVPLAAKTSSAAGTPAKSQVVEDYGRWQLGFGAGMASGYGFSIRRWVGEFDAVQLNLAPYVSRTNHPEEEESTIDGAPQDTGFVLEASVSVGLTWLHEVFQYRLDPIRELKLLSYVAGSAYLSIEQQQMDSWRVLEPGKAAQTQIRYQGYDYGLYYDDYRREERTFRLGTGMAGEFSVWRFSAMMGLGLGGWYESVREDFGVSGDIQIGTHFRF